MSTMVISPVRRIDQRAERRPVALRPAGVPPRSAGSVRLTRRGRLVVFLVGLLMVLVLGFFLGAGSVATKERGEAAPTDPLTPRELEVVKLIAEAYTNQQIAEALVISPKTVERHRANVMEKLGMHDRVELTRYAIRRGLVLP